jgi:crotonobetainyl-CoA:carnitine CoA-transferase CaiB-like acyl-CoA transferase
MGNENFTAAPSGTFRTATGPLNIAANEQKQYEALCDLVGRADLKTDPRFAERQARKVNRAALKDELEVALATRGAEEWEALFNAGGVPAGCVLSVPQVLREAQVTGRQFVETIDGKTTAGTALRVTRPGFRIDGGFPMPSQPPALGQDTEHWLRALGYSADEIDHLRTSGATAVARS